MAILKIARMGHPVLLQTADPVADPTSPEIRRLVADMFETLDDIGGAGLAAPQVHVPLRLFIFRIRPERVGGDADDRPIANTTVINPVLSFIGEQRQIGWEGCLSIPGLRAAVPRAWRVRYEGVDTDGNKVTGEATGAHAAIVQHEYDHLDGILYPMRMGGADFVHFGFTEDLAKAGQPEFRRSAPIA
ncbi:MAG: peptide deformylase [Alphaproteobacteria bacterium]|nr:peptide deformylase [Alphaproteobacteria bacterium]